MPASLGTVKKDLYHAGSSPVRKTRAHEFKNLLGSCADATKSSVNKDTLGRAGAYFGGAIAIGALDCYQTINRSLFHFINSCKFDQCGYQGSIMGASIVITAAALYSKGASKKRLVFNLVPALFNMDLADDISASLQSHAAYYFVNLPQRFMDWRATEFGNTVFAIIANFNKIMVVHMQLGYFAGIVGIVAFGANSINKRITSRPYVRSAAIQVDLERARADIERNRVFLR